MNDFYNKQICSYKDIDRFGFTCDVCGRKVNGCHYINGMSFCEKCYQETFGKDNQQNEIQQLKQQLAEKDTRIAELEDKDWYEACIKQLEEQNDRLIDKLEEKDEKIKKLRFDTQRYANDYREMALTRQIGMEHLAINELEKAKALLFSKAMQITGTGVDCVRLYVIDKTIDQQIKELKGEKDVTN